MVYICLHCERYYIAKAILTLTLIGPGFLEGKKTGNGGESAPLDNFKTTNSDVMKLCTKIVHH